MNLFTKYFDIYRIVICLNLLFLALFIFYQSIDAVYLFGWENAENNSLLNIFIGSDLCFDHALDYVQRVAAPDPPRRILIEEKFVLFV